MKVFVSNSLSKHTEHLRQILFSGNHRPLEKRWVIVPSEEVKQDLYLKWLENSDVIAGIKTITYNELIRKIFPLIPSKMELALRIEAALGDIEELKTYLQNNSQRKIELASELSALFLKYLQSPVLELSGWQQLLWEKVFGATLPTEEMQLLEGSFFFYHISSITPYEWDAFSQMDTTWFLFSPSEMYIGDLIPERQQKYLIHKVNQQARENLEEYFKQDSPLLSNWGVQGRNLLRYFEDADTIEHFVESTRSSALDLLKQEWLTLQKEESTSDDSIQLHSAPNLLREVEVVWEIIQRLPFKPREIIVLAPDIQPYAAAIEWVFKERGGPFDFSITGIEAITRSPLLQGLELLLSLPSHRFSRDIFKKLLLCPPFLKRFQLKFEEGETLDEWMTEVHLRYDLSGHSGSWNGALKRVIESLVSSGSFDFSDTQLINRWIEITLKLEKTLAPITDGIKRSADVWAGLIEGWIETFFATDEEADILRSLLATLRSSRIEGLFSYETIEYHLNSAFRNPSGSMNRSNPETVRFTSLREGAVSTAKAIICMGMHEGAFPRTDPPSSLPLIPIPNRIEEDRYLFLEAISHAEEHLILTYQRCHPDDGKEMQPSPIVQELIKDRGGITTIHHPHSALDSSYYQPEGFKSYSTLHYNLLHITKSETKHEILEPNIKKIIDIRVLRKLARHPVQCFLEEGLGVRFPWEETDSEFLFSPIEMHHIRKKSLKLSNDQIMDELEREGKLPTGAFRSVALCAIDKELESYRNALAALEVDPACVFSLELTPHAKTMMQISKELCVAPPLQITLSSGETVELQGVIENVTPKGLLFHGQESMEDLLKVWPLYLIVQIIVGETPLLLTEKKVPAKISVENPREALERYVNYLQKGLQSPSPLLPAWGRRIFKGGELPATTEDKVIAWAQKRNLLPPPDEWVKEWQPILQKVVHELI